MCHAGGEVLEGREEGKERRGGREEERGRKGGKGGRWEVTYNY